ncbi:MAG: dTDP-4-dehydrorhamnose reductase, partial [Candidatus Aceula meridiana]|nr:dTDP-4-dehydrorhamnose reductase [Candidatus Aceula meridiana]
AFCDLLTERGQEFHASAEKDLDITSKEAVTQTLQDFKPTVVINCASYNDVDQAEEDSEKAFLVNAKAVQDLSGLCQKFGMFLVHFSSDYVFDGEKKEPYVEADKPCPISVYGESKLKGEEAVVEQLDNFLIFRLSWLYGKGKQNFLYKLSQWAKQRPMLEIASDEVSIPTSTAMVAAKSLQAIEKGISGIFHLTNSGSCSRFELSEFFLKAAGFDNIVKPVPMAQFPTKAKRPGFSVMSNAKIVQELGEDIPTWQESMEIFIKENKDFFKV